jgi:hypothetical protein
MTGKQDRWNADYQPRAADSAACLLVVGGYEEYGTALRRAVSGAGERVLMSPALGDFIEVRFCDLGPRPSHAGRGTPEVARLVLELTSRPRDVARNFSAVLVFDESALVVDHLLQACAADPALRQLNARCLGIAGREDRPKRAKGSTRTPDDIVTARSGKWNIDEFIVEVYALAERLLNDFGSGWQPGVRPEEVSRLGSVVQPAARGVIARTQAGEDARSAPRRNGPAEDEVLAAAKWKAAERQEQAAMEAAAAERAAAEAAALEREVAAAQRAEAGRQLEGERLAAARQRIAALERQVAELKRARDVPALDDATPSTPSDAARPDSAGLGAAGPGAAASLPAEAEPRPAIAAPTVRDPGGDEKTEPPSIPSTQPQDSPTRSDANPTPEWEGDAAEDPSTVRFQRIREIGGELVARVRGTQPADPADNSVAQLLSECVGRLREGNRKGTETCLAELRRYATPEVPLADRERCRAVMIEVRALSPQLPAGSLAADFYDVLLRLVYGQPLGYPQYRDLEYCLELSGEGALPPALPLFKAIDRACPTDPMVLAVTRYHLGQARRDERVRPRPGDTRRLIGALAEVPLARADVRIVFAVLSQYLSEVRTSSERREITGQLRSCGFLAAALARSCPDELPDQTTQLIMLLRWAYPKGLVRNEVDTLFGSVAVATSALLPAILRTLAQPGDRPWAIKEFLRRYSGRDIGLRQAAQLEPEIMHLALGGGSVAGELPAGH